MATKIPGPGKKGFVLDDYVLYNLNRTAATYNDEMAEALRRQGLDTTQWRILLLLEDEDPITIGDIARRSVTKMPTVTRIIIRMEEQGLVKRRPLKDDKRIIQVFKTAKAKASIKTVQAIGDAVYERAFDGFKPDEIRVMTKMLKRVRENLSQSIYVKESA